MIVKELSIEEKAKLYDEALKVLHKYDGANIMFSQSLKEEMFPELKESEDERIRKFLIQEVTETSDEIMSYRNMNKEDVLAWLEKKREQEDEEECEELIKMQHDQKTPEESIGVSSEEYNKIVDECIFGDPQVMYDNAKMRFIRALERVEEQSNKGYKLTDCDKNSLWEDFKTCTSCIIEQKPAWNEEDDNYINYILINCMNYVKECGLVKKLHNDELHEQAKIFLKSLKERVQAQNLIVTDEELAQAKKNAYNDALDKIEYHSCEPTFDDGWSAAIWYLKKRNVQPHQKQEWSEDDNYILNNIYDFVAENLVDKNRSACADECLKWLKSIKERVLPQTKQEWSEEDIDYLDAIIAKLEVTQDDALLTDNQMEFLKSLKYRVQPKVELTQLDKNILEAAIAFVKQNNHFNCWRGIDKRTVLSALHSITPQNTWKPSKDI